MSRIFNRFKVRDILNYLMLCLDLIKMIMKLSHKSFLGTYKNIF